MRLNDADPGYRARPAFLPPGWTRLLFSASTGSPQYLDGWRKVAVQAGNHSLGACRRPTPALAPFAPWPATPG